MSLRRYSGANKHRLSIKSLLKSQEKLFGGACGIPPDSTAWKSAPGYEGGMMITGYIQQRDGLIGGREGYFIKS